MTIHSDMAVKTRKGVLPFLKRTKVDFELSWLTKPKPRVRTA
jgi:hypothetical protein